MVDTLLRSMCTTYRHDFGLLPDDQKESLMRTMRQLYQHDIAPFIQTELTYTRRKALEEALPENLADIIEKELKGWKGANGGVYAFKAAAIGISIKIRAIAIRALIEKEDK